MAKHLVEINEDDLRAAKDALGLSTIKDTVAAALVQLLAAEARKREVARLEAGYLEALSDQENRRSAWQ